MPLGVRRYGSMNRYTAARVLSIVAHPALLVPLSAVGVAVNRGASPAVVQTAAQASIGVAAAVMVYSLVRVRSGRWSHADASRPAERMQLNVFLVGALLAGAAYAVASDQPRGVVEGLLLSASLVVVALLLRGWLKLSLHVAFAAFAALLWWPTAAATAGLLLVAAGLAWSRLYLQRHTAADVLTGATAGVVAGLVFQVLMSGG